MKPEEKALIEKATDALKRLVGMTANVLQLYLVADLENKNFKFK